LDLAQRISAQIDWHVFDREILDALHTSDELGKSVSEALDERLLEYREEWIFQFFVPDHESNPGHVHRLSRLLFSLAMRGRGIFVGRGAPFVIPAPHRLAILAVRSFDSRLAAWRQQHPASSQAEAKRELQRQDHSRAEFIRRGFHRRVDDPAGYDLCINLDTTDVDHAAQIVVEALHRRFPTEFGPGASGALRPPAE
jgi:cytidylate kinase